MKELSLHIIDIVQNSIAAGAKLVTVSVIEDIPEDKMVIEITDNGCGMSEEFVKKVTDPFTTGRKTRRVGLGIPLLKLAAESTGGNLTIDSEPGRGTNVRAVFGYSHIDRQPLGDMADTMLGLVVSHYELDFIYSHRIDDKTFEFDTREIKKVLGGIPFSEPEVYQWISGYIREGEDRLIKEV